MYAKTIEEQTFPEYAKLSLLPEYLGRPWHYKHGAKVTTRISRVEAIQRGWWPGYYVEIRFDDHCDHQTLYPRGHMARHAYVRVSRRLWREQPHWINVFCQYSRRLNHERGVRARIAK